jgi:alkaline phosphatase D
MQDLQKIRRRAFLKHLMGTLVLYGGATFSCLPEAYARKTPRSEKGAVARLDEAKMISKLAFGSCCEQDKPQPIWDRILALKPDLFVFLGDNIYADTEDMKVTKARYDMLGANPEFARFRSSISSQLGSGCHHIRCRAVALAGGATRGAGRPEGDCKQHPVLITRS